MGKSGGRTSAIIASIQKLKKRSNPIDPDEKPSDSKKRKATSATNQPSKKIPKRISKPKGQVPDELPCNSESSQIEQKDKRRRKQRTKHESNVKQEHTTKVKQEKLSKKIPKEISKPKGQAPDEIPSNPKSSLIEQKDKRRRKQRAKQESNEKQEGIPKVKQEKSRKGDNHAYTSPYFGNHSEDAHNATSNPRKVTNTIKLEEDATLKHLDKAARNDFRKLGFARWKRNWLPIIQLGPYDVPPGPVRDGWIKLFHKVRPFLRLSIDLTFLQSDKQGTKVGVLVRLVEGQHVQLFFLSQ